MSNIQNQLNRDGFVLTPSLLSQRQLKMVDKDIRRILDNVLNNYNLPAGESIQDKLICIFDLDISIYLGTVRAISRLSSLQRIFLSPAVLKTCSKLGVRHQLLSTTPVVHIMSDKLEIPDGYFGQPAHQDWTSMQGSLNALTFWVALTEVTSSNYAVEVVPGSHLLGLIPGDLKEHYYEVPHDMFSNKDFFSIQCKAGDALVFSTFLVHRTVTLEQCGFRLAVSFRFDDAEDKQYISRCFPTAYKRVVDRTLNPAEIPSVEQIHKIYSIGK